MAIKLDIVGNPVRRLSLTGVPLKQRGKATGVIGASVTKAAITYPPDELVIQLLKYHYGDELELTAQCGLWFDDLIRKRHQLEDAKIATSHFWRMGRTDASPLKEYQKQLVTYGLRAERFINADDRGLGKTLEALTVAKEAGCFTTLIVCPGYLKLNWKREIEKWLHESSSYVCRGDRPVRMEAIQQFKDAHPCKSRYLIVNYEMLRLNPRSGGYPELTKMHWDMVIFDEAHRLKGRQSQWVEGAKAICAKTKYVQMLTGNPIDTNPDDIWQLLNLINPRKYSSYWAFVEYFCNIIDNFFGKEIAGVNSKRMAQLQYELQPYVIRRLKKEVAPELPDKLYHTIEVEMENPQKRFYRKLEKDMVIELANGDLELIPQLTAKHLRLQQAVANPALIGGKDDSVVERTTLELLEDLLPEFHKAIVGTWFVGAADRYEKLIGERLKVKVFRVRSELKDVERDEVVEAFKRCSEDCVLVGTIRTMGEGLNIDECDLEILTDKAWTPLANEQFEDRIHRTNSTRTKHYYSIVVKDTVSADKEEVLSRRVVDRDEIWAMREVAQKLIERNK